MNKYQMNSNVCVMSVCFDVGCEKRFVKYLFEPWKTIQFKNNTTLFIEG